MSDFFGRQDINFLQEHTYVTINITTKKTVMLKAYKMEIMKITITYD
jgi:hypothetical protein